MACTRPSTSSSLGFDTRDPTADPCASPNHALTDAKPLPNAQSSPSATYIQGTLRERPGSRERNLPFLESFVRPAGLDRPATPAAVDAIEALAAEKGR